VRARPVYGAELLCPRSRSLARLHGSSLGARSIVAHSTVYLLHNHTDAGVLISSSASLSTAHEDINDMRLTLLLLLPRERILDPDAALADNERAAHADAVIRVSRTTHKRDSGIGLWDTSSEVGLLRLRVPATSHRPCSSYPPTLGYRRLLGLCPRSSVRTKIAFVAIPGSSPACDRSRLIFTTQQR
jgi:hypothetical protein